MRIDTFVSTRPMATEFGKQLPLEELRILTGKAHSQKKKRYEYVYFGNWYFKLKLNFQENEVVSGKS